MSMAGIGVERCIANYPNVQAAIPDRSRGSTNEIIRIVGFGAVLCSLGRIGKTEKVQRQVCQAP